MVPRERERRLRGLLVYILFGIVSVLLVGYLAWALRSLVFPVIVGSFLAFLFKPLVHSVKIPWLPKWARVVLVLSTIVGIIIIGTKQIQKSIPDDKGQLSMLVRVQYKLNERLDNWFPQGEAMKGNSLRAMMAKEIKPFRKAVDQLLSLNPAQERRFRKYYRKTNDEKGKKFYSYYLANIKHEKQVAKQEIAAQVNEQGTSKEVASEEPRESVIVRIINAVSTWLVMPFVFIFLLFDHGQILRYVLHLVPNRYFEMSMTIIEEVDTAIGRYLRGTLMECSLVGATLTTGLILVGIQYKVALLIGVVAGVANAIPFLGPLIGLIVGLGYALIAENITPILPFLSQDSLFVGVLVVVAITQVLDNVIYQPIVLGSAVNLHPLVVIIGVMGGSTILGFSGMLLAVPTIVIFKVITETLFENLRAYKVI